MRNIDLVPAAADDAGGARDPDTSGVARTDDGQESAKVLRHRGAEVRVGVIRARDRLRPADAGDTESFKTRKGKVGGYRDYFSAEEIAKVDEVIRQGLSPAFGYLDSGQEVRAVSA